MPKETRFDPLPVQSGNAGIVSAPFQFVTTGEDNLRVTVVNSQSGLEVAIQGRRLDNTGTVLPLAYRMTPTFDRLPTTRIFPLGIGALVNLTVFVAVGSPKVGQTFVIVELVRGREGGTELLGTLLSGYITDRRSIGWPGSPLQSSTEGEGFLYSFLGSVPLMGNPAQEFVPTGARWEVLAITARFTTSATVADRTVRGILFHPYGYGAFVTSPQLIGASQFAYYTFTAGLGTAQTFSLVHSGNPFPSNFPLPADSVVGYDVLNLQPGDQFSEFALHVREWLEV